MMRRIIGSFVTFVVVVVFVAGCESFGGKATYSKLIDQVYYTRGASESSLGAYGIEDNTGIDAFEREGPGIDIPEDQVFIRSFMTVTAKVKGSASLTGGGQIEFADLSGDLTASNERTRRMSLLILDVHKDWLVDAINQDANLLGKLKEDSNYRIVTAVAILTEYDDKATRQAGLALTAADHAKIAKGKLKLSHLQNTDVTLSAGTVYGYQFSIPCFNASGDLRYLKTDRPGTADRLPMNTTDADGRTREPGIL